MNSLGPTRNKLQFSWGDYSFLSNDNLNRFKYSDPYIAYALVSYSSEGIPVAHEFTFPTVQLSAMSVSNRPAPPTVKGLRHISLGRKSDGEVIEAVTVDNDLMTTQRSIHFEMQYKEGVSTEYTLFFFSPRSDSTEAQNLSWEGLNQYDDCEALVSNMEIRGGEIELSPESSSSESLSSFSMEYLNPHEVMGGAAIDAYNEFQQCYGAMLSRKMNNILTKSVNVHNPYSRTMASFKRPEWCHAIGKQFFREGENPNEPNNLGAAPLWMNSQMMIFEESLKWHAQRYPQAYIKLISHFHMFDDSDVIYRGDMEGIVQNGDRTVLMHQDLLPHQLYPAYPQATDIAICTFVLNGLLLGKELRAINCVVANAEQFDVRSDTLVSSVTTQQLHALTTAPNVAETVPNSRHINEQIDDAALNEFLEQFESNRAKPILKAAGTKRDYSGSFAKESVNDDEINKLFDECEEKQWKLEKKLRPGNFENADRLDVPSDLSTSSVTTQQLDALTTAPNVAKTVPHSSHIDEQIDDVALTELLDQLENNRTKPILTLAGTKRVFSDTFSKESVNDDEINKLFDECEAKKWKLGKP